MIDPFDRVAIVGLGLIGSSIARALRKAGIAGTIVAIDRDPAVRARVLELGIADEASSELQAVAGADFVMLCVPVLANASVAQAMASYLAAGAIVSDVGSVKGAVVRDIAPHLPAGVHFVPAHPVAGTEHSGPDAGFAELFVNRWSILTPPPGTDEAAIARVRGFWEAIGSNVEVMTPEHHDLVLAITSHVPHLIAYNIVGTAADMEKVTQG
jgi:cyclohexadieny/prephenate dehydrogenase